MIVVCCDLGAQAGMPVLLEGKNLAAMTFHREVKHPCIVGGYDRSVRKNGAKSVMRLLQRGQLNQEKCDE